MHTAAAAAALLPCGACGRPSLQLWRLSSDLPVSVFRHQEEVFTIKWSPAPPADGQGQLLAAASCDRTVRLYDSQSGR